jgi:CheY-like chemotaxis protein
MSDVLVVDDEMDVTLSFPIMLKRAGFTCRTAESRLQALAAAREQWPDVVLLDLALSGQAEVKDGWQLWDELAQLAAGRPLRVIVISAEVRSADKAEAERRGGVGVLLKTAGPARMAAAVRAALSASQARAAAAG